MLSENLQKYRKDKKYTKKLLGKKANVHFNTIKYIEQERTTQPTITTLKKLAAALDVTVDDLIK